MRFLILFIVALAPNRRWSSQTNWAKHRQWYWAKCRRNGTSSEETFGIAVASDVCFTSRFGIKRRLKFAGPVRQ